MNFPPPLFRSLHSSLIIAFHFLPSPFITFHYLSSPFIAFYRRPSHCPPTLCSPPFCPGKAHPAHDHQRPRRPPASHLLPSCFITPFVSHIRLSRTIVCAPLFYSLCFTHSIVLRPLFYFFPLCFTLSHCLPPSLYLLPPPSLYLLPLFCTRFFTPRQPPQTRPRHRKRQRFSHFSKKFCKKPLTKQKKVLY